MSDWGNSYGHSFRFTVFGESHGPAVGIVMEGIPAGSRIDLQALQAFLSLRSPGSGAFSSERKEADVPEFISGLLPQTDENRTIRVTCGTPLTAIFRNTDAKSSDYETIRDLPRPGHADYPAAVKFGGFQDSAGGGHFSGRLTAPLCAAGGICLQLLEKEGITVSSEVLSVGGKTAPDEIRKALEEAKAEGDSLGGVIACTVQGLPVGLGEHMFGGMENRIASAVFAIPAVKGIEFGDGFALAGMRGSESNDAFESAAADPAGNRTIRTKTNHCGGILGGMTDGMPLVFRVAVKPTPSIAKEQDTVDLKTRKPAKISVPGRHDCCIALRAAACVTAAAAAAIYDALLDAKIR